MQHVKHFDRLSRQDDKNMRSKLLPLFLLHTILGE